MKLTEPGCLALVIDSREPKHIGITVTVLRKTPVGHPMQAGRELIHADHTYWEIDPGFQCEHPGGWHAEEKQLLRIDGDAESDERIAERKDMEVPA